MTERLRQLEVQTQEENLRVPVCELTVRLHPRPRSVGTTPSRPRGLGTADQALTLPLPSQDTGQPPSPSVVTFFLLTGNDTIN